MGIMDTIKQTTPQDLMLTSVFAGAAAGILGYLDSLNLNRYAIYNKGRNKKEKFINGALFGGIVALPLAYISATSVLDKTSLGNAYVNPVIKGELPPAPKDYVYATADGEQPYLILDPKYGL
jgi:hypothetical protein